MRGDDNITKTVDWVTISIYLGLVILGWLFIYSARYDDQLDQGYFELGGEGYEAGKQFLWFCFAGVLIALILLIDFKFFLSAAWVIYAVVMFLFVLVLIFGTEINGARSWFDLGFVKLQPSEFGKFATALAVAKYISSNNIKYNVSLSNYMGAIAKFFGLATKRIRIKFVENLVILVGIIALPPLLIILQKDAGSALVYSSFIIVLVADGLPMYIPVTGILSAIFFVLSLIIPIPYLLIALGVIAIILFALLNKNIETIIGIIVGVFFFTGVILGSNYFVNDVLQNHQRTRITVLLGEEQRLRESVSNIRTELSEEQDSEEKAVIRKRLREEQQKLYDLLGGAAYNINNSKMAISYGGATGQGYKDGLITKGDHVPEQHTDFIFSTVAEELGWVGSTFVIALFVSLMLRVIFLAERQKSHFARVYGYSVAAIFFLHFTINIGMAIGLFPVIGIPLPFFSYGGSSLWAFTILLFIFLKLDMHRGQILSRS